jgi:anthranilate synthase component 1
LSESSGKPVLHLILIIMETTQVKVQLEVEVRRIPADLLTPVSLFLRLRNHYTDPCLLESNDFSNREASYSYLGLDTIASFSVQNNRIRLKWPDGEESEHATSTPSDIPETLWRFLQSFQCPDDPITGQFNGLFGHTNFDGARHFDRYPFSNDKPGLPSPVMRYQLSRFILVFNHFKDEVFILENRLPGQPGQMDELIRKIHNPGISTHPFHLSGQQSSNITDEDYRKMVRRAKAHCQRGDVFQLVLSRRFQQAFTGDEFQVYRALRSLNPSPYLFYFDYGNYRIFGSSPESQIRIRDRKATLNPIAGTFRRTGDPLTDTKRSQTLLSDPKENAEHTMLVDLARNDLSRHTSNVRVEALKEVHYYSHVMHLVSTVSGDLPDDANPIRTFADTFPAGTLSGAPKFRAMELIEKYENTRRSFYGGSLGYLHFNGNMNQAILIRSFMSQNNCLYFQAGAGIVVDSDEEKELQEVNHKLMALKQSLINAEKLYQA